MSLDADAMADRRRLKRGLLFWRVLAILLAVAIVVVGLGRLSVLGTDHIAQIDVTGLILDDPERDAVLRRAAEDRRVRAVIVRIDSPGGTVVGGEALYRSLRMVAERKPVIAEMGTLATSAGYMAAAGADHIVAREGTITGSIGVILQATDLTGLLEKLGIRTEMIRSGPLKGQPNPLEPMSPEAREATAAVVRAAFDLFVDLVAERRPLSREEVLALSDGRIYSGRQALDARLVDTLGGREAVRRWLAERHELPATMPVQKVHPRRSFAPISAAVRALGGKTVMTERLTLDGLVALLHPELR